MRTGEGRSSQHMLDMKRVPHLKLSLSLGTAVSLESQICNTKFG